MNKNVLVLFVAIALCAPTINAQNLGLATSAKSKANDVVITPKSMTPSYSVKTLLFEDDFSSNTGWTLGSSWEINAAVAEPATDHTPTGDNGIMACPLGIDYANDMSETRATSSFIDCSGETGVILSFWSYSGCENSAFDEIKVNVIAASIRHEIWSNSSSFQESQWTYYEFDISAYAAGESDVQIEFTLGPTDGSVTYSGWAIDDLMLSSPEAHDLGVIAINPSIVALGDDAIPQVTIENFGASTESSYSVSLVIAGTAYDATVPVTDPIAFGETAVIEMPVWSSPAEGVYSATATVTVADDAEPGNNELVADIEVADVLIAYGFNAYGGTVDLGPVTVLLPAGEITSIAPNGDLFWAGGDWANGIWYACQYSTNVLLTADPATGVPTNIGTMRGANMTGLAFDVTSGTMYASAYNDTIPIPASELYSVNLGTASTEIVGTMTNGLVIGIACDMIGNMYAIDIINDNLLSVNTETGAATEIGTLGIDINFAQDIAFDRDNDILYGTLYNNGTGSGGLYEINVSTGEATLLNDFVSEVTGFAIPYSGACRVTFIVTDGELNPLDGANININGSNLTTVSGEALIILEDGSYDYIVTMDGYYGTNGNVVVDGSNVTEEVSLERVNALNELNTNISIYPNPSNGTFVIKTDQIYTLEVFSITGELVFTQELTNTESYINLGQVSGMYIVHLINGEETLTSKIIVE